MPSARPSQLPGGALRGLADQVFEHRTADQLLGRDRQLPAVVELHRRQLGVLALRAVDRPAAAPSVQTLRPASGRPPR